MASSSTMEPLAEVGPRPEPTTAKIGQQLTHNERSVRERAVQVLSMFLSKKALTPLEYRKLWKALLMGLWMADKRPVQQDFCVKLVVLLRELPVSESPSCKADFVKACLEILLRDWNNLDVHRMDKYRLFVRILMAELYQDIRKNSWDLDQVKELNAVLESTVLNVLNLSQAKGMGLTLQVIGVFWDNVSHEMTEDSDVHASVCHEMLRPYLHLFAFTKLNATRNKMVDFVDEAPSFFRPLLKYMLMSHAGNVSVPQENRTMIYGCVDELEMSMQHDAEDDETDQMEGFDECIAQLEEIKEARLAQEEEEENAVLGVDSDISTVTSETDAKPDKKRKAAGAGLEASSVLNKKQRRSRAKWALKAEAEAESAKTKATDAKKKAELLQRRAKKDSAKAAIEKAEKAQKLAEAAEKEAEEALERAAQGQIELQLIAKQEKALGIKPGTTLSHVKKRVDGGQQNLVSSEAKKSKLQEIEDEADAAELEAQRAQELLEQLESQAAVSAPKSAKEKKRLKKLEKKAKREAMKLKKKTKLEKRAEKKEKPDDKTEKETQQDEDVTTPRNVDQDAIDDLKNVLKQVEETVSSKEEQSTTTEKNDEKVSESSPETSSPDEFDMDRELTFDEHNLADMMQLSKAQQETIMAHLSNLDQEEGEEDLLDGEIVVGGTNGLDMDDEEDIDDEDDDEDDDDGDVGFDDVPPHMHMQPNMSFQMDHSMMRQAILEERKKALRKAKLMQKANEEAARYRQKENFNPNLDPPKKKQHGKGGKAGKGIEFNLAKNKTITFSSNKKVGSKPVMNNLNSLISGSPKSILRVKSVKADIGKAKNSPKKNSPKKIKNKFYEF